MDLNIQTKQIDNASPSSNMFTTGQNGLKLKPELGIEDERNDRIELMKLRRKNKNSKNGCLNCKQRKIKCDETLPSCSFCERKHIDCPYLTMTPFQINQILTSHLDNKKNIDRNNILTNITNDNDLYYQAIKEINLNNNSIQEDNSMYKAHEIEGVILKNSMGKSLTLKNNNYNNYKPLQTIHLNPSPPNHYENTSNLSDNNEPLYYNSKIVNKKLKLNPNIEIENIEKFQKRSSMIYNNLLTYNFEKIFQLIGNANLDVVLNIDYFKTLLIVQIFSKLLRRSFVLFTMDYYKNILLCQKVLPLVNYETKLSICCKCENDSYISIDQITKIIKDEYLPIYNENSLAKVDLLTGSFVVLNYCLVYHFKNGLKYELSLNEGNKAVNLLGIFSTGLYSIVMGKSKVDLLTSGSNLVSAHLISDFKNMIIPNYSIENLDELKKIFDKLSTKYTNDVNYENLSYFLEKHCILLKNNINFNSFLGYNNGYIIRILNSFHSIIPYDLSNLDSLFNNKLKSDELKILIYLFYYTVGQFLNSIISSIEGFSCNSFYGTGWLLFDFDSVKNLVKLLNYIESEELKLIAIYLIRSASFLKKRRMFYKNFFTNFKLTEIIDESTPLSIEERYAKLMAIKNNDLMNEIHVKSFTLEKGQFIREWNYPNLKNEKPSRKFKVSDTKITNNFQNNDELINDFIQNANGFFSKDYDPEGDLARESGFATEVTFIDGFEMKMLWKLLVYIRINNL